MSGRGRGRPPTRHVLTPAEQRVLEELRRGGTNVEIAVRLGLSPETVKTHIASMLAKLRLSMTATLASWRPDRERRRLPALPALPPALASLGRPLLWAGAALGGMADCSCRRRAARRRRSRHPPRRRRRCSAWWGGHCEGTASIRRWTAHRGGVLRLRRGAVPNPTANTELVEDCKSLLKAKDRLAGTATLNWSAARAMTNWEGVTVARARLQTRDAAGAGRTQTASQVSSRASWGT